MFEVLYTSQVHMWPINMGNMLYRYVMLGYNIYVGLTGLRPKGSFGQIRLLRVCYSDTFNQGNKYFFSFNKSIDLFR